MQFFSLQKSLSFFFKVCACVLSLRPEFNVPTSPKCKGKGKGKGLEASQADFFDEIRESAGRK